MLFSAAVAIVEGMTLLSLGLWIYWATRTWLLLRASDAEIRRVLASDLSWLRRAWWTVRAMFVPPSHIGTGLY